MEIELDKKKEGISPKISVIMGIYNCEDTLEEAIRSVSDQTVTDWELILCDDASVDGTWEVAKRLEKEFPDKIILLRNSVNHGLNYTLNKCLTVSKGKYIARMDGDDRCREDRFAQEIAILEGESNIDIVSSDMEYFDESGIWGRVQHPEYPMVDDFIRESPFCHAPCMITKRAYDSVQGYSESKHLLRVEDYELWIKMYEAGYRGKNIHEPLYQMRDDRNAYSRRKFKYRINEAYVKILAIKKLKLPPWTIIYVLRPIMVGLLPRFLYDVFHKRRLGRWKDKDIC